MANNNSTQLDLSRFQTRSYGWRKVDIIADRAIDLLESSFQTSMSIEGLAEALQQGLIETESGDTTMNSRQVSQFVMAIQQLAISLNRDICNYATTIEEKIEAANKAKAA